MAVVIALTGGVAGDDCCGDDCCNMGRNGLISISATVAISASAVPPS